jgi:translation initiation factor 2 subunit 3
MSTPDEPSASALSHDVMRLQPTINITMIGSVSHGKSVLSKALSKVTTGKFKNEKKFNKTIKLGYANFKIFKCKNSLCLAPYCYQCFGSSQMKEPRCKRPKCKSLMQLCRHLSLVDSPGHHQLMATMVSGQCVTDGCILVIAANEKCPAEQTTEHFAVAEMMGTSKNTIVVQNKVDLCTTLELARTNKEQIKVFLSHSAAQDATIIPVSAVHHINIDVLCQKLVEDIPIPIRNLTLPVKMMIIRSFDVNKPGTILSNLAGGVVGGSLLQGILRIGDLVEIRPGIIKRSGEVIPIMSRVNGIKSDNQELKMAVPGGLIAVSLTIDPVLSKADRLVGQVLGTTTNASGGGALPPVFREAKIEYRMMRGKTVGAMQHFTTGERLLICVGSTKTEATVTSVFKKLKIIRVKLDIPACCNVDDKTAIFRDASTSGASSTDKNWRLIASGRIEDFIPVKFSSFTSFSDKEVIDTPAPVLAPVPTAAKIMLDKDQDQDGDLDNGSRSPLYRADLGWPIADLVTDDVSEETAFSKQFIYGSKFPNVGDCVLVRVKRIESGIGGYCSLLGYGGAEALIVASEVNRQQIDKIICVNVTRVDAKKNFIDVTKRRVQESDRVATNKKYQEAKVLYNVLFRTSRETRVPVDILYNNILYALPTDIDTGIDWLTQMSKAIKTTESLSSLYRADSALPQSMEEVLVRIIKTTMSPGITKAIASGEMTCFATGGIDVLRNCNFNCIEDRKEEKSDTNAQVQVQVRFISSPLYTISFSHIDKEFAIQTVTNACSTLSKLLIENGGYLNIKDISF